MRSKLLATAAAALALTGSAALADNAPTTAAKPDA